MAFNILDHVEKLTPVKGSKSKYYCPVCNGNDFSVGKAGAYQCFSGGCDLAAIRNAVSPAKSQGQKREKTYAELEAEAAKQTAEVENQVATLISQVVLGNESLESALVFLSSWCDKHKYDRFTSTQLLRAKYREINPSSVNANGRTSASVKSGVDEFKPNNSNGLSSSVNVSTDFEAPENLITEKEWEQFRGVMSAPGSFNPFKWTPEPLSKLAMTDAARNSIDPLAIWAYLLPATLSMMGNDCWLDMSGWKVPNIIWSLLVAESGTGKSRAESLVLGPLKKWNLQEFENWKLRLADWNAKEKAKAKDKSDDSNPEEKPTARRYLINQSTPEAIVRRLAGQEDNGVLCYRDEFAGFINGLTQYTGGKGDGMEMMLETWDGGSVFLDRANEEDSFSIEASRLSLVGGIQPKVFERTFDTGDDSQGILARFLVAVPRELPYQRFKGASVLPAELSKVYQFIDGINWGTIHPTIEADDLFTEIAENFNNQRATLSSAQPWVRKLAGQTLRLALGLHAIQCYYDRDKATDVLTVDTLRACYEMAKEYQAHFYHLIGASASEGLSGILAKIQEIACESGDGITARDIARGRASRQLQTQARMENMKPSEFCLELFNELSDQGYGQVVEVFATNGRKSTKYKCFPHMCPKPVDTLTEPTQSDTGQGIEAADADEDTSVDTTPSTAETTRYQQIQDLGSFVDSSPAGSGDAVFSGPLEEF